MDILLQLAKEYSLFVALVAYVLWAYDKREKQMVKDNKLREDRLMKENEKRENKYIEREEKYIGIVQTLSEEVKERLTKIETTLKRR